MKPFTEGEIIKECMMSVAKEVCPETKGAFENISLSARTVIRRTEELLEDFKREISRLSNQFLLLFCCSG